MDSHFWKQTWEANEIRFHRAEVHPYLREYFSGLKPGKVLVPLCGKSLDMIYLAEQGHQVVGVELSSIACEAFFKENGIAFSVEERKPFQIYRGRQIEIWCGDFFGFPPTAFDYYYDRAALVALPPSMRAQYASHLKKLLPPDRGTSGLVITFEYPQDKASGPPFSVPESEVRHLFSDRFEVQLLVRKDDLDLSRNSRFVRIPGIYECAYRLT